MELDSQGSRLQGDIGEATSLVLRDDNNNKQECFGDAVGVRKSNMGRKGALREGAKRIRRSGRS